MARLSSLTVASVRRAPLAASRPFCGSSARRSRSTPFFMSSLSSAYSANSTCPSGSTSTTLPVAAATPVLRS